MIFINPNEGWGIATDGNPGVTLAFSTRATAARRGRSQCECALVNLPGVGLHQGGVLAATSLSFVDSRNGFWATGSKLYKTTDGGHTWIAVQARVG